MSSAQSKSLMDGLTGILEAAKSDPELMKQIDIESARKLQQSLNAVIDAHDQDEKEGGGGKEGKGGKQSKSSMENGDDDDTTEKKSQGA